MLPLISLAAFIAIVLLGWNLYRRFGTDRIEALMAQRRTTSRFVSRGSYVDGNRHLDVALALDQSTLFYENRDMAASIDLQWVREIEYDTKLATGAETDGGKVLRLRSQSQTFEFVLPDDVIARWHTMLPRRPAESHAV
jgi:hypothetical protein